MQPLYLQVPTQHPQTLVLEPIFASLLIWRPSPWQIYSRKKQPYGTSATSTTQQEGELLPKRGPRH